MLGLFSCREQAKNASLAHDGRLSGRSRMILRMHLAMCRACRRFARQIRDLDSFMARCLSSEGEGGENGLSVEAKERIRQDLERE
ncbi:MAG: zf-HC2 domain-containing protein [Planctomycetota bacterium]